MSSREASVIAAVRQVATLGKQFPSRRHGAYDRHWCFGPPPPLAGAAWLWGAGSAVRSGASCPSPTQFLINCAVGSNLRQFLRRTPGANQIDDLATEFRPVGRSRLRHRGLLEHKCSGVQETGSTLVGKVAAKIPSNKRRAREAGAVPVDSNEEREMPRMHRACWGRRHRRPQARSRSGSPLW